MDRRQLDIANKCLRRRAEKIKDVPYFRGIPATAFDKEHLLMLCTVFAEAYHKHQELYFGALDKCFTTSMKDAATVSVLLSKQPTLWRRIWNRIKKDLDRPL